jgi:hypothetical protein
VAPLFTPCSPRLVFSDTKSPACPTLLSLDAYPAAFSNASKRSRLENRDQRDQYPAVIQGIKERRSSFIRKNL